MEFQPKSLAHGQVNCGQIENANLISIETKKLSKSWKTYVEYLAVLSAAAIAVQPVDPNFVRPLYLNMHNY